MKTGKFTSYKLKKKEKVFRLKKGKKKKKKWPIFSENMEKKKIFGTEKPTLEWVATTICGHSWNSTTSLNSMNS